MKIEKIDHIAIVVRDLEKAERVFSELFETEFAHLGEIGGNAKSIMDPLGLELVEPLLGGGAEGHMKRRGEGLYVLSLKVANLDEAMAEMGTKGVRIVGQATKGNVRMALCHPKDCYGVCIELIEYEAEHPVATERMATNSIQ